MGIPRRDDAITVSLDVDCFPPLRTDDNAFWSESLLILPPRTPAVQMFPKVTSVMSLFLCTYNAVILPGRVLADGPVYFVRNEWRHSGFERCRTR